MKHFIKKVVKWILDRSGIAEVWNVLMNHQVPSGSKWAYVFGSATLFCFLLQVATGVGLALLYQPSSDQAFKSLEYITYKAAMGKTLRSIHYYGASGMIIMMGIHMLRVYLTAAYKYPREMNWLSGVVLMILTIGMGFTGQLLRWDDNGVWSAVVAAEQLGRIPLIGKLLARLLIGGDTIGGQTLSRFFAYHVFLIPALIFTIVGLHLWLVIRNGISEPAKAGQVVDPRTYRQWYKNALKMDGVSFWPYAAWRDAIFSGGVILIIVAAAVLFGAPQLGKYPDPSVVNTQPKPDWYLLWIYALFALMPPEIESYVMFFGPVLFFFLLFSLPFLSNKRQRSPIKRPWAVVGSAAVVVIISALLVAGTKAHFAPAFHTKSLPASILNSHDTLAVMGGVLFEQKACLYCHKMADRGGRVGPDLTHVANRMNEQEMMIRIVNGARNMPAYGSSLSKDELTRLIAFLKSRK